jgi:glutamine amidotransferase
MPGRPYLAIIDYGRGNLRSVAKAFETVGAKVLVTGKPADLKAAAGLVLPGVGAFADAMQALRRGRLDTALLAQVAAGKPLLGVCLGMQVLFSLGLEYGRHAGLGLFAGTVRKFPPGAKVPHMGWNRVELNPACPLFKGIASGERFYFVHSYYAQPRDPDFVAGRTDYAGLKFCSAVWAGRVFATQFHPEKSQAAGLRVYKNYWSFVKGNKP